MKILISVSGPSTKELMRDILLDIIDTVCSSSKKDPFKSNKDENVNGDSKMSTPIYLNITEISVPEGKIHFLHNKLKNSKCQNNKQNL